MASVTMTSSLLGAALTNPSLHPRKVNIAKTIKAQSGPVETKLVSSNNSSSSSNINGRRAVMFAAAAAAICGIVTGQEEAMAGDPPKKGTPEAKKYYAPVCVTMPTASVCYK